LKNEIKKRQSKSVNSVPVLQSALGLTKPSKPGL